MTKKQEYINEYDEILKLIDFDSNNSNSFQVNKESVSTGCPMLIPKPWMGHIVNLCTASLIAPNWAISAKHCNIPKGSQINFDYYVDKTNPYRCVTGINYRANIQTHIKKVHKIFSKDYDVVLLELDEEVKGISFLELANIPRTSDINADELTLYSIGSPYNFPIRLPLNDFKHGCDFISYKSANFFIRSDEGQVKGSICKGDSGSAIVIEVDGRDFQVGVMSHICPENIQYNGYGARGCGLNQSTKARIQIISADMHDKINSIINNK